MPQRPAERPRRRSRAAASLTQSRGQVYLQTVLRRLFVTLLSVLVFAPAAAASADVERLRVVAWASTASKAGIPPAKAVSGGTYCTARAIRRLYAFVRFTGMRDGKKSSVTWYFNRKKVYLFAFKWEDGDAGRTAFNLYRTKGALEEGTYGVEVRSAGRLLGKGSVKLRFGSC